MLSGTLAPLSHSGPEQPSVICSWYKTLSGKIQWGLGCFFVVVANRDLEELLNALHNLREGWTVLHAAVCCFCSLPSAFLLGSTCSWLKIHGKQLSHSAKALAVSKVFPFSAGMKTRTLHRFFFFVKSQGEILLPEKFKAWFSQPLATWSDSGSSQHTPSCLLLSKTSATTSVTGSDLV